MKRMKLALLLSIILTFLSACSTENSSKEEVNSSGDHLKELTFLSNFPSETLDPHLNWTPLRAGMVETLVKMTEDLKLEPWLAEEWKSEDNGQTWIFKIRDDITFQNGNKLDGEAVKASLERNIQVSEAMKASLKIKSIRSEGQMVVIKTEQPLPQFPSELVHPNTAIIDVSESKIEQSPVGTGPFKVVSYEANSKLVLDKYQGYWDGKVQLDRATLTFNEDANARTLALQAGDADIVYRPAIESLETLATEQSNVITVVPSLRTHLLMYNMSNETLKDINVRKAFDALINRNEVVESIMAGQATVANGPFLPEFPFTPNYEVKSFGIDLAKKHLEAAGYEIKDGKALKDGKQLSLQLFTYSYRPELPLIAQLIQSNAKQIGINIEIQIVENIDEYLSQNSDWGLATYSLNTAPRGDASYFLNSAYMVGGALNPGHLKHDKLIEKINELNKTVDEGERNLIAKDAITIIDQERLHSFIVYPNNFAAYKNKVQNWNLSKSEFYVLTKDTGVK
ncbi:nickel ABC transporter substrate-binding protein [Bacillus sp. 31A1R]|uniref:Nickel ABC transporter substrate-binding protein n=1 Tax=Robertmurraya mangrovi TaxID=3098077 RepID=A0ABU5J2Z9_9BACI|nr:nickel ABC transporter substrate-binding protein [Bacillus sp. 31A1R]MDZ5473783.1 nickel ABC transporter substrate-binding protein [Bacillus sp. 31A1R]